MAEPQSTAPADVAPAHVAGAPSNAETTPLNSSSSASPPKRERRSKSAPPQRPPGRPAGGLWFAPETVEKIKQLNAAAKKS